MSKFISDNNLVAGCVIGENAVVTCVKSTLAVTSYKKGKVYDSFMCLDDTNAVGQTARVCVSGAVTATAHGSITRGGRVYICTAEGHIGEVAPFDQTSAKTPCGIALTSASDGEVVAIQLDF